MFELIREFWALRKRPYIITEIFFCIFLFFFLVLSGDRFAKFATLSGAFAVMFFGAETLIRGEIVRNFSKLGPMVPFMLFVLLSLLVLPLIPYAGSRVWNNATGLAFMIVVFLMTRRFGTTPLINYFMPLSVILLCFLIFVAPGLIGAEGSTGGKRLDVHSTFTGGGLGASHLSVVGGIALFLSVKVIFSGGFYFKKLFQIDTLFHLFSIVCSLYLVVVRSGSRQGLIWYFLAGMFCYAIYTRRNIFLGILFTIPVSLIGMGAMFFFFQETETIQRIIAIFDPVARAFDPEKSVEIRQEMLVIGFDLWKQSPIWGNGNEAFRVFGGLGTYSHNNYVELLANYGALGLLLFYIPFFSALIYSVRGFLLHRHDQLRQDYLWIVVCILAILVSNVFIPSYFLKQMLIFIGIVIGRLYYLKDNEQWIMRAPMPRAI